MAQIVLKDVSVTINAVDLSNRSNNIEINYEIESVEVTAFGGNRSFNGGIQNVSVTVDLMQDFATSNVEATVFAIVGTQTDLVFKPTSDAVSATNPEYTITGAFLSSHTPLSGTVGELSMTSLSFTGGTLTKATS
jgi:hypothetical protein